MDLNDPNVDEQLKERFKQLPKIVQNAIVSADIEKHLRSLADSHQLHLDQWNILETEVQMTLLGFQETDDLQKNIETEVGVTPEIAAALAQDISKTVFEPIREQLERELGSPQAKEEVVSDVERVRNEVLKEAGINPNSPPPAQIEPTAGAVSPFAAVVPGTPPPPPPDTKAVRAPMSESYTAQNPSTQRKVVEGDPYREQLK